tara:strand:+ start:270 stop:1406 length:1137 start_codon:yes stop_codon:yes gene_type:complete
MIIKSLSARAILDSRGEKTIEISVNRQKASSPSGKSTGDYETPCYRKNLDKSISDINHLPLKGLEINSFSDLKKVESLIKSGYKLKKVQDFGANALFALESAILKALAKSQKKQLWQVINEKAKRFPLPLGNVVEGGMHAHSENKPEFQEFLIIPSSRSPKKNLKTLGFVHKILGHMIRSKKKTDEGAWESSLSIEDILALFKDTLTTDYGLDVAASSFYKNGLYFYKHRKLSRSAQIEFIVELAKKYKIKYIEDPLEQRDFAGFSRVLKSTNCLICGDDLTATQLPRVAKAIKAKSINSLIIKPNQNGSLLELAEIFSLCKKNKIKTILSHRSGETLDDALADYAFAFQADYIKCGISTKWRHAKLKRLVKIEKQLK